ncbi:cupin domain-containing protein [Brenneria corticis]|uniref:cupin domain-containing protein n=1 Tax=Brenneria corticis TaxID=2173106 RepID=UPI001FEDE488|nr:cupin domain-containing protein [Brenneria sp. CFCC 11842]
MRAKSLTLEASSLPETWKSRILGVIGQANIKLIRMDKGGIPAERHDDFAEALILIEGNLQLDVEGQLIEMKSGDYYLIPRGKTHRVLPGSDGTLLLIDAQSALS